MSGRLGDFRLTLPSGDEKRLPFRVPCGAAGLYTESRGPHTFWLARGEIAAPEDGIINLLHYEDAARYVGLGLRVRVRVKFRGELEKGFPLTPSFSDAESDRATVAALVHTTKETTPRILLVADDAPLTRCGKMEVELGKEPPVKCICGVAEVMTKALPVWVTWHRRQICEAAVSSPLYQGKSKLPTFKPPEAPAGSLPSLGKVYDTTVSRAVLGGWRPLHPSFSSFMATVEHQLV